MAKKNILLIEDDIELQKMLKTKLTNSGFSVITASDGEEALQKITNTDLDLVLLDVILPKMDGFNVLKQIKTDPETKKIPVLIFSNLGEENDIQKGKELGAIDFLIKSKTDLKQLIETVKLILF